MTWGPDGILDIVPLSPGVDCAAAKRAADTYMSSVDGFMTSNPLEVTDGWTCRISLKDRGEIVRCTAGRQQASLNRRNHQTSPGTGSDAGTTSPTLSRLLRDGRVLRTEEIIFQVLRVLAH